MSDETKSLTPRDSSPEERLERVLAEYLRQVEQGSGVDQQAILAVHPDLADDLREFFANQARMQQLVGAGPARASSNGAAPSKLRYFGDYEILEEIAHGGMGVVYKARQTTLNRIVAVKMILAGQLANESDVKRFQAEAEAAANLHHPGVVGIYEVGVQDGQHYYSMEYIDGRNLAQLIREKPLPIVTAAEYVRDIATVLEYAHEQKVLHRDLKPSNILLDASGRVRIADFGLAKRVEGESDLTMTGQVLGTPSYMSPEQAAVQHAIIGATTDIYALGSILYELVTGRPPFRSENVAETLRQVQHDEPVRPRLLNPKLPRDLETICLKCLEKEPSRRYISAQHLADDLGRYSRGEPIVARPVGSMERTWRWCQRNPVVASLMTTVAASVIVGTTISAYFAIESGRRANEAEENFKLARRHLNVAHMNLAQVAWEDARVGETIRLLDLYRPAMGHEYGPDDFRGFEWHYWNRLAHSYQLSLQGHTGYVMSVAFSMDGKRLASASDDQTVKVWDATSGQQVLTLRGHMSRVNSTAFSPDGKRLASASGKIGQRGELKVWDATNGQETHKLKGHTSPVNGVAFSPDGNRLASVSGDIGQPGELIVWDLATGQPTFLLKGHMSPINGVTFNPDGKRLASASDDGTVTVWDSMSSQKTLTLRGHAGAVNSVAFSSNGKRLASAGLDGKVLLWDSTGGEPTLTLNGHISAVMSVAFSVDGKKVASASRDQTVKLWDATDGQEELTLKGHTDEVMCVTFSPDGKGLASASLDQTIKVWDITTGQETLSLNGHTGIISSVAFCADGTRVASASDDHSGSYDHSAKVWNATSGQQMLALNGHADYVTSVSFSPHGEQLATASRDRTVKLWDAARGQELLTFQGHTDEVMCVAFSPDGKRLASASRDHTVKLWDIASRKETRTLQGHADDVMCVAFSPDGKRLASSSRDRTVKLWDATSGQESLSLKGHTSAVWSVAFSPDGKRLASASGAYGKPGEAKVWDATSGQELLSLKGHASAVWSVAFSPDGKRLASASDDQTVKVWDVVSGQESLTLRTHNGGVTSVAFSRDGKRLASGGQGKAVAVWDARPWTPELRVEQQSLCLIRFLRAKPLAQPALLDAIAADATISESVRKRALELAHDWPE